MSEPLYKSQRSNKTGAIRQLVSHDDGATWEVSSMRGGAAPENDNAEPIDESPDVAAPADVVRQRQAEYEAEHPEEVATLRELGFRPPDVWMPDEPDPRGPPPWVQPEALTGDAPSKVVNVTAADGGPIPIEGDPNAEIPEPPKSGMQLLAESASDAARGVGQGATLRWGDEGAAALAEAAPREGSGLDALARRGLNLFGADLPEVDEEAAAIPKTYAAGSRYADMRDTERRQNAQAQERSPVLYTAGEVAGAVPGAIASAPAAGGALPARIAANMAAGGVYGGISGAGGSEAQDAVGVASDAVQGAEVGAVLGGGITAAAAGAGKAAQAARPGLEKLANRARAAATGAYGGELARLTERHGPQYAERLGADIERLGLHKRPGGKLANLLPSDAGVYRANAEQLAKQTRDQLVGAIDDATAQGVTFPKDELLGRMRAVLKQTDAATPEGRATRAKVRGLMEHVRGKYGDNVTPAQLQRLKKIYEHRGGFKPTQNLPAGEAETKQMYQQLASAPRTALRESVQEQSLPETAAQFRNARDDHRIAKTVENLSRKREAQELGNQLLSLPTAGYAGAGAVAGAAAQGAPGAAMGMLGAVAANEGVKRFGRDALADVARAGANRTRGLQTLAESLSGARAVSGAQAVPVGQTTGFAAGASIPGQAVPAMASPEQRSEATGNANGYRLEGAVRDAMARNPQALGPYAQQVQEAISSSDPDALRTLIVQLSQDETFRTQIAPALTGAR